EEDPENEVADAIPENLALLRWYAGEVLRFRPPTGQPGRDHEHEEQHRAEAIDGYAVLVRNPKENLLHGHILKRHGPSWPAGAFRITALRDTDNGREMV